MIKLLLLALLSTPCLALNIGGKEFKEFSLVSGKNLVLNGVGLRTATIFKLKVYGAGLYLEKLESNADKIINSEGLKKMQLIFMRSIDAGDIQSAWEESIKKNVVTVDLIRPSLDKLKTMIVDVKEDDQMTYLFEKNTVKVLVNGFEKGVITDEKFPKAMLATWLGKFPPNEELKEGLLGAKTK